MAEPVLPQRSLGILLMILGALIAVAPSYAVATMSQQDLLELIRGLLIALLVIIGSIVGAVGFTIYFKWGLKSKPQE